MRRAGEHFVCAPRVLKRKDRAYSCCDPAVLEHLIESPEAGGCHVGIEEHRINIFAIRQRTAPTPQRSTCHAVSTQSPLAAKFRPRRGREWHRLAEVRAQRPAYPKAQ